VSNWWISAHGLQENDVTVDLGSIRVIVNRGPERDHIRTIRHR
jgi:hypothetical protein